MEEEEEASNKEDACLYSGILMTSFNAVRVEDTCLALPVCVCLCILHQALP